MEIIANFDNQPFLNAVKNATTGDIIAEKFGNLEVKGIYDNQGGVYEERLSPTVLYRKRFENGVLLKKTGTTTFIFVPREYLN